jgi:hypothetical protein
LSVPSLEQTSGPDAAPKVASAGTPRHTALVTRVHFGHRDADEASDTRAMAEAERASPDERGPRGVLVAALSVAIIIAVLLVLVLR